MSLILYFVHLRVKGGVRDNASIVRIFGLGLFEFVGDLLREYLNQYPYIWNQLDLRRSI